MLHAFFVHFFAVVLHDYDVKPPDTSFPRHCWRVWAVSNFAQQFPTKRNNTQQHARGCANGRNMQHSTLLRRLLGALCSCSLFFTAAQFTLVAASFLIFSLLLYNFHVFSSNEIGRLCFLSLALDRRKTRLCCFCGYAIYRRNVRVLEMQNFTLVYMNGWTFGRTNGRFSQNQNFLNA